MLRKGLGHVLGAGIRSWSRRGLLSRRGTFRLPGLAGEVRVLFDSYGVPHIRAQGDADAFLAQGFCHAIDRFFQMDMIRRTLAGRLAETVGERRLGPRGHAPLGPQSTTADADRLMRSLDLGRAADAYIATARDEDRTLMDAYVRGVNSGVALLRRRRPVEYRLARIPLVEWTRKDSVLVAKGMALGLSFKWRTTPMLQGLAEHLAERPAHLASILPPTPAEGDFATAHVVRHGMDQALQFLPTPVTPQGSNAFVVGRGLSASGMPLLASDPHLELSLPSIWYLAGLRGARYEAVGCSLPGLPGIVIGRTPTLAWGLTNGMIDDGDFWAEEVDGTGTRYRVDGAWRPLEIETQSIRRRGAPPILMRLRRTHRGPLVTDAWPGWTGAPLSLRLTLHEPAEDLQTFLALGRSRTAKDAKEAARSFGSPVQNLLFADTRGDAGFAVMGHVPLRAPHPVHPGLIRDGTDGATDWRGWIPTEDLPAFDVGPRDVGVNANEPQVTDPDYPYLSHLYEPPYRAQGIRDRLAGRTNLTIDDLGAIQLDATNGAYGWFRRLVLLPHVDAVRRMRPSLGRSIDRLLAWDGQDAADSAGALLWHLTYHHLVRRTFGPALGERHLSAWMALLNFVDAACKRAFEEDDGPWAPLAVRPALLQAALEDAERDLRARRLGPDAMWGRLHTLTLRHPLSSVPGLGEVFTRGPLPLDGGPYSPCTGQYAHHKPGEIVSGVSYRQLVDLADPERRSRMITFGGQSGHVASPHYDDLTPIWLEGGGLPMPLERDPTAVETMILAP